MDSRDVIESAKPPKPPRPPRTSEPVDHERRTGFLLQGIAVAAVAAAVFTGITAWETHRDRVNSETIYCTFYAGIGLGGVDVNDEQAATKRRLAAQLGC